MTTWRILGDLKNIFEAVRRHASSMAAHALSHKRGAIVRHIWGRSSTVVMLQIRTILHRLSPHLCTSTVGGFKVDGGSARSGGISMYLIFGCMGVRSRGGKRALRIPWRACRLASARSTIVRVYIVLAGDMVRPRST